MTWMWSFARPAAVPGAPPAPTPDAGHDARVCAFLASYVAWSDQSRRLETAYERWRSARDHEEREFAFRIYRAELDIEEHMARAHAEAAERLDAGGDDTR